MSDDGWNSPVNQDPVSVLATETQLITSETNRPRAGVIITPTDGDIWYGAKGVTALNGQPLSSGQTRDLPCTQGQNWYAIRQAAADVDVRVTPVY